MAAYIPAGSANNSGEGISSTRSRAEDVPQPLHLLGVLTTSDIGVVLVREAPPGRIAEQIGLALQPLVLESDRLLERQRLVPARRLVDPLRVGTLDGVAQDGDDLDSRQGGVDARRAVRMEHVVRATLADAGGWCLSGIRLASSGKCDRYHDIDRSALVSK